MDTILGHPHLKYVLSATWGMALAIVLFQKACKRKNCIVVMSDPSVPKTTFRVGEKGNRKCVRFEPTHFGE